MDRDQLSTTGVEISKRAFLVSLELGFEYYQANTGDVVYSMDFSTQRGQFFRREIRRVWQSNSLECCLQVWHGKGSIRVSITIVKAVFIVCRRHFLQTGKRAGAQAPFYVYVCLWLLLRF